MLSTSPNAASSVLRRRDAQLPRPGQADLPPVVHPCCAARGACRTTATFGNCLLRTAGSQVGKQAELVLPRNGGRASCSQGSFRLGCTLLGIYSELIERLSPISPAAFSAVEAGPMMHHAKVCMYVHLTLWRYRSLPACHYALDGRRQQLLKRSSNYDTDSCPCRPATSSVSPSRHRGKSLRYEAARKPCGDHKFMLSELVSRLVVPAQLSHLTKRNGVINTKAHSTTHKRSITAYCAIHGISQLGRADQR